MLRPADAGHGPQHAGQCLSRGAADRSASFSFSCTLFSFSLTFSFYHLSSLILLLPRLVPLLLLLLLFSFSVDVVSFSSFFVFSPPPSQYCIQNHGIGDIVERLDNIPFREDDDDDEEEEDKAKQDDAAVPISPRAGMLQRKAARVGLSSEANTLGGKK